MSGSRVSQQDTVPRMIALAVTGFNAVSGAEASSVDT